ncbi:hypothetical protein NQ318_016281 [Aromia moschata]|uniref:Transposase n=1 Tax=Aromia moschata TaxID=1265417 RepID=A0AAV8XWN1_9CUCU|nr:hypothetical protein NQ318_016281 [Aromia moschata]
MAALPIVPEDGINLFQVECIDNLQCEVLIKTDVCRLSNETGNVAPDLATLRRRDLEGRNRILKKEILHPYHYTTVQQLLPQYLPAHLQFAQFLQQNMQTENPDFLNKFLFTDEATFTRRGVFNWRNNHLWDSENPHSVKERHFQHEFKVNICCGVISNFVNGPFESPPNLTGPRYLNCRQHHLNEFLEDVPLALTH